MSRYTDLSPIALALFSVIEKHSSQRPISLGDVLRRASGKHSDAPNALQALIDARLITTMTHIVDGVATVVYWPTGLKPIKAPTLEQISMASEPKNAHLTRLILLHGPIAGPALAEKARENGANIPAKNVPGLLETRLKHGDILSRKINGVLLYMTHSQAEALDAEKEAECRAENEDAHVMSAPISTKQSEGEIPENETTAVPDLLAEAERTVEILRDNITGMLSDWTDIRQALDVRTHDEALLAISLKDEWIAKRDREIHTLKNDVAGANLVLRELAKKLSVEKFEDIPGAFDELIQELSNRAMHTQETGRLALLNISEDGEQIDADLNYLEPYVDEASAIRTAKQIADIGSAQRCIVMRVLGQAERSRAIWTPMVAPEVKTLRDAA